MGNIEMKVSSPMTANSGASLKNFALISQWRFPQPSWVNYSNQLWVIRSLGTHWECHPTLNRYITVRHRYNCGVNSHFFLCRIYVFFQLFLPQMAWNAFASSSPFLDGKAAKFKRLFEGVSDLSCSRHLCQGNHSHYRHISSCHIYDKILLIWRTFLCKSFATSLWKGRERC